MNVNLLTHTPNPEYVLYTAYKTCYSEKEPFDIWLERKPSTGWLPDRISAYVATRLEENHTSPMEHVSFTFAVSGISRACANELVRHHVGVSFSQQSMRYVDMDSPGSDLPVVFPASTSDRINPRISYGEAFHHYATMKNAGVPLEDARYVLPLGTKTNLVVTVNLAELYHIGDQRLCTRAQWEIRKLVSLMRKEVVRVTPLLGKRIGPPCMETRLGYCPESFAAYRNCPLSKKRPHKSMAVLNLGHTLLNEQDLDVVENTPTNEGE